jgi:F-type H+-transporting ATPase subunit epsilon
MATISFDLVSPEQLLFNDEAGMIIVPGKDGDIGVLPRHSKVLSSLRPGRVMVYGESKDLLKSFFVAGGFVEINPEKCIVLAEGVNEMIDLDKDSIQQQVQELESSSSDSAKEKLTIAQSKIAALDSTHYEKL